MRWGESPDGMGRLHLGCCGGPETSIEGQIRIDLKRAFRRVTQFAEFEIISIDRATLTQHRWAAV